MKRVFVGVTAAARRGREVSRSLRPYGWLAAGRLSSQRLGSATLVPRIRSMVTVHSSKDITGVEGTPAYSDVERQVSEMQRGIKAQHGAGRYQEAIASAEYLLSFVEEHLGRDHPVYASTMNDMALFNKLVGNYEKAVELYTMALTVYRNTVSEKHRSYLITMTNLGLLFKEMSQASKKLDHDALLQRSIDTLKEALDLKMEIYGAMHPEIGLAKSHLGAAYHAQGKKEEAEELLRDAVSITLKAHGDDHLMTATAKNNLGVFLKAHKQYDEALKLYEDALQARQKKLGAWHQSSIISMHNIAELHRAKGDEEKAVEIQEKILDIMEEHYQENKEQGG